MRYKKIENILLISTIPIILILFFLNYISNKNIFNNAKYTIGVISSEYTHTRPVGVKYQYSVNNEKYQSSFNINSKKGDKYLLIYDSLKPNKVLLLSIYPLDINIKAPANGWKYNEVPISIDSIQIKKYVLGK